VQKGSGEQRACYVVCRVDLVNRVLAMQCAEGLGCIAFLVCCVQRGSVEQRACYAVCRGALVNNVLAM
jgi:hypothetical protein